MDGPEIFDSAPYEEITVTDFELGLEIPADEVMEVCAAEFHKRNELLVEKEVMIRGVLALLHQNEIKLKFKKIMKKIAKSESTSWYAISRSFLLSFFKHQTPPNPVILTIGEHKYTRLESQVLYLAWTRTKRETFRNLSRLHRLLIAACIYAAMTHMGWDQAAMAGAAIEVMKDLDRPTISGPSSFPIRRADDANFNFDLDHNTWLLGLTVGVPFFAGAVLGLVITDPITGILGFGRRGAICLAGICSFISVIGSASVHRWEHLLGFRVILGAGMAGKASIVPILLSETSPKNIRGILLVFWQLFVAFGLAAGSVANLSVYRLHVYSSWRYMFIAAFIPALLLLSLVLFSPESPRWLLKESGAKKGRGPEDPSRKALVQEAFKSLIDLRGEASPILAAGELFFMHMRLIDEQHRLKKESSSSDCDQQHPDPEDSLRDVVDHIGWWPRVKLMFFRVGPTRRAHFAAAAVMISQQLCGINLIAFLADTFFRYSFFHHNHNTSPSQNIKLLSAALGLMLLNFLATIPALFVIDRSNGRRQALNWSFPFMAVSLLGSALVLKAPEREAGQPSISTIVVHYMFLVCFVVAYSIGEGPAAFVISAEVFPLVNRELGMSLAVFWNFIGAGLLAVFSPWLLKVLDQFGVLLLFAGLNMVAWFLCFWLVPSTGNEDLEDVHKSLEVPSDYRLVHSSRVVFSRSTKLMIFCINFGTKPWGKCHYGTKVGNLVEEWDKYRMESDTGQVKRRENGDNLSDSNGIELCRV